MKKSFHLKDRPLGLYVIIAFAIVASGLLWRYHADFEIDITIELLGAFLTIVIIDQLLLKSKRKRWNLVRDEIEYTLGRTVNTLRDDVLRSLFSFEPDLEQTSSENIDDSIRKQKDKRFMELLEMDPEDMLDQIDDDFLEKEYEDYFLEKAEDLWRLLNTRYSEHFDPELVEQLLNLNLHLRDLHSNINFYKRSEETSENGQDRSAYYEKRGGGRIVSSTKDMIKCLVKLKEMGYSMPPRR